MTPHSDGSPEELIGLDVQPVDSTTVVVAVTGEVDMYTAPLLEDCLHTPEVMAGQRVVINLGEVDFLDSSGLALLVQIHQQTAEQQRELRVVCADGIVKRAITATGLDRTLALYHDVHAATA